MNNGNKEKVYKVYYKDQDEVQRDIVVFSDSKENAENKVQYEQKAKSIQKEQAMRETLEEEDVGEQIKINFGGRILEEEDKKGRKTKNC